MLCKQRIWSHPAGEWSQTAITVFQRPVDLVITSVQGTLPLCADPATVGPA